MRLQRNLSVFAVLRLLRYALVAAVALGGMFGVQRLHGGQSELGVVRGEALTAAPSDGGDAVGVLAGLELSDEHRGGYDRDLFAHWSDLDGNGCDTRRDVLAAETLQGGAVDCVVQGGQWLSAYDGIVVGDAAGIEVDHVVALAEAWDSGAWRWDAITREMYANDVDDPRSLIAVTAASNQAKSAHDLSEWRPSHSVCAYVEATLAVKARWGLSVDAAEHQAISELLTGECAGLNVSPWPAVQTAAQPPADIRAAAATISMDGRYGSCADVKARGLGPYMRGIQLEYGWYPDPDLDGVVCD